MASSFLKKKAEEERQSVANGGTAAATSGTTTQNRASSFLQKKAAEARQNQTTATTKKETAVRPTANTGTVSEKASASAQSRTANAQRVQAQRSGLSARQAYAKSQNAEQEPEEQQQTTVAGPYASAAGALTQMDTQSGFLSADRRNTLYQAAMETAQAQLAQEAAAQEAAEAEKLKPAKAVQAQRSGLSARQALTEEDKPYQLGEVRSQQGRLGSAAQSIGLNTVGSVEILGEGVKTSRDNIDAYNQSGYPEQAEEALNKIKLAKTLYGEDSAEYQQAQADYSALRQEIMNWRGENDQAISQDSRGYQIMQAAAEKQAEALDGLEGTARFLASTGLSVADNLSSILLSGGNPALSLAMMSTKAAAGRTKELTDEGVAAGQALTRGAVAGAIEAATEKMGLDNLMDLVKVGGKSALVSLLKQAGIEGTEEGFSYLFNYLADKLAKDPNAEFDVNDLAEQIASGAVSGLMFGVGGTVVNALGNYGAEAQTDTQTDTQTDPAMEQAIELLRQGAQTESTPVVAENATTETSVPAVEENTPVSATERAQERSFEPEVETASEEDDPVLSVLRGGSASAETLAKRGAGNEAFWNRVDELVENGTAAFDDDGNLFLVKEGEHIDRRTAEQVGDRKVKAFQYLHPQLHRYYAQAAQNLLYDLEGSTKASRYQTAETGVGMDRNWTGEKRNTVEPIARLLDNYGFTYDEVRKGLEDIIKNHGAENYAKAKRLELVLDDIMTEGYTDIEGMKIGPDDAYIQAKSQIAGAVQTDSGNARSAEQITRDIQRVQEAASALGENGSRALSTVYADESVSGQYSPEDIVGGFYAVYNNAMNGTSMNNSQKAQAAVLPESVRFMAETAGMEDARRAKQAQYFGKDSKLVRDDNWKKANLSSKTSRKVDALAKVLGVQVRFVQQVEGGTASGEYRNGVISVALDSDSPVMSVVLHESVHRLREISPEGFNQLSEYVKAHMSAGQAALNQNIRKGLYQTNDVSAVNEETVADAFGVMLNDSGLLEQFAREHTTVLQRMADSIRDMVRKVRRDAGMEDLKLSETEKAAFSDLANDLAGMEKVMRDALRTVEKRGAEAYNEGNGEGNAKYSKKGYWRPELSQKEWELLNRHMEAEIGDTKHSLDAETKYVYAEEKGVTVFALYGVGDGTDPTPLYASRGKTAQGNYETFRQMEAKYNADNRTWNSADQLLETFKRRQGRSNARVSSAQGRGAATGNVRVSVGEQRSDTRGNYSESAGDFGSSRNLNEHGDKPKFKLKQPVEESGDLVALHNLTEDKLLGDLRLGGFPMPSIAVTKASIPHTNFGNITLVMDKTSIDPKANKKNTVYSADAWTPTFPAVEYEVNTQAEKRVVRTLNDLSRKIDDTFRDDLRGLQYGLEDQLNRYGGEKGLVQNALNNYGLKAAYLETQGKHIEKATTQRAADQGFSNEKADKYRAVQSALEGMDADTILRTPMTELKSKYGDALEQAWPGMTKKSFRMSGILRQVANWLNNQNTGPVFETVTDTAAMKKVVDNALDNDGYNRWVKELFSGVEESSGVYNNKELYTPSGARRSFKQTHYPATLDGIVKSMAGQNGGNIKNVSGFYGVKSLRAGTAQRFKSIADMHKLEGRLQNLTQAEMDTVNDQLSDRMHSIMNRISEKSPRSTGNDFMKMDNIGNILVEVADTGTYTIDNIEKVFNNEYGYRVDNGLAADIRNLLFDISQMPVNMFEAKPQRAIGFDEVLTAVIPSDSSAQLRAGLEQAGVPMLEYEAGNETDRLEKVNSVDDAKFSKSTRAALEEYIKQYGELPRGEAPARDVILPSQTADDRYVSQTVRTILEAGATPDTLVPTVEELVADGDLSFERISDEQAMTEAEKRIRNVGWADALTEWTADMNRGVVSKQNTAMGWALYNNAANSGDTKTAITILNRMVGSQRSAAQALQATRILKKLSPEAQLYQVQRSVANLQEEINNRYGKKGAPELVINEELAAEFMKADTQEKRDAALRDIYRDIGRQMPSNFRDKWNAWRYLAMLGNPRTHVRNIVGNLGFVPVVEAKNLTATAIEQIVSGVSGGKLNRTKSLVLSSKQGRALLKAAWGDYAKVQETAMSGGKYSDLANANQYIEEGRQIFKFKPLEKLRKGNSAALDAEDVWFSQPHYAYALASYAKAHNISAETIQKGGKAMEQARAYAVLEAQKATYRDTNAFSQMVSGLLRVSASDTNRAKKGLKLFAEGVLPFRKTPANILVRGIEYSPLGLVQGVKQALVDVKSGKVSGAQAIDRISAGLTGTGLMALGAYLVAEGVLRGHGSGEEDENQFEELMGHQAYALELSDGTSVTLDWLAPEALPFFIGANLYEQTNGEVENLSFSAVVDAISTITEPLLEMSMLQSLNDLFDSVGYASSSGLSGLPSAAASAATSYLTQALPTLLGQIERTAENTRYTTYTDKTNRWLTTDMQYTIGKASARVPGLEYQQIPYIDAWGREESTGEAWERALNNFVNPAYTSQISESAMEQELLRLYDETGESGVFPSRAAKYFTVNGERKDLTAEEYVQYAQEKGQTAYQLVTELVESKAYQALSDADKAEAVKEAYDYANQTAKQKIDSAYSMESWITKAQEAEKTYGISQSDYITLKIRCADIESLKDKNGNTLENSKGLQIMELVYNTEGLTEKQRKAMFEYLGVGKTIQKYNKALVSRKLEKLRKQAQ